MNDFSDLLTQYMKEYQCSIKYLSDECGISMAKVNRLRNGLIIPTKNEKLLDDIIRVLQKLALRHGVSDVAYNQISINLKRCADDALDFETYKRKIDVLVTDLDININDLSEFCDCDPSLIYRLRKTNQIPRKPLLLAKSIANFVSISFSSLTDRNKVLSTIDYKGTDLEKVDISSVVYNWLINNDSAESLDSFISRLDSFDYGEFLRSKSIDKIRIPTLLFQIPANRTYYGMSGMEEGVLSFLKSTVFSRSKRDVIIYNDHPIDYFIKKESFLEKWMKGLGMFVIKNLNIYMIHVIDRPINELMAGLEAWVPLYMTGKVIPYYLENSERDKKQYNHILMVSGKASFAGDSIANHPESGQFNFSKSNSEVERCRLRAEQLLQNASPLMNTYVSANKEQYQNELKEIYSSCNVVTNILTVPPAYTISDELLDKILARQNIDEEEKRRIKEYVEKEKERVGVFLKDRVVYDSISRLNENDFSNSDVYLSLSGLFLDAQIGYTWEEYSAHCRLTEEFSKEHDNYFLDVCDKSDFKNIRISVFGKEVAIVSKNVPPNIHFIIKNRTLVKALFNIREFE